MKMIVGHGDDSRTQALIIKDVLLQTATCTVIYFDKTKAQYLKFIWGYRQRKLQYIRITLLADTEVTTRVDSPSLSVNDINEM